MANINGSRFWLVYMGLTAIGVVVVSIIAILITLGYLPAHIGLVFITVIVAVTVWFGWTAVLGETVKTYQNISSKSELIAGALAPARYVIASIFGVLILAGFLFFGTPADLGGWYYFGIGLGIIWIVGAVWGWFRRNKAVAQLEAQPEWKITAKQKSAITAVVVMVVVSGLLEFIGWQLSVLFVAICVSLGIAAGIVHYRVLFGRYSTVGSIDGKNN